MRFHRSQLAVLALFLLGLAALAIAAATSGCRTAGPQICIRDSHDIAVRISGDLDTMQGKTVSTEGSLAASVAATLRDITAAYSGDATRTGESGESQNAAAADAAIEKGDQPGAPADDPAPIQSEITNPQSEIPSPRE